MTTVTTCSYHHLADCSECPDLVGMTVREALLALRTVTWGDLGGALVHLSDGTSMDVVLQRTSDGNSRLMSSQRAERREDRGLGRLVRTYSVD